MAHAPFLLVITALPVTTVMFLVAALLYFYWHIMKKLVVVFVIVVGIYYIANDRTPWTPAQSKRVQNGVLGLFKEDKTK